MSYYLILVYCMTISGTCTTTVMPVPYEAKYYCEHAGQQAVKQGFNKYFCVER